MRKIRILLLAMSLLAFAFNAIAQASMSGYHGPIYLVSHGTNAWKTPHIIGTHRVTIHASTDRSVIVVVDETRGVIYSSTNSGMSWKTIDQPGTYEFLLSRGPDGLGLASSVTISGRPGSQPTDAPDVSWYASAKVGNGTTLVVSKDMPQGSPVLSIRRFEGKSVISWPAPFTNFVLQANTDLISTNWTAISNSVTVVDGANEVTVPSTLDNHFFRLEAIQP